MVSLASLFVIMRMDIQMTDDGGLQFWQEYQQQFAQQLEDLENEYLRKANESSHNTSINGIKENRQQQICGLPVF